MGSVVVSVAFRFIYNSVAFWLLDYRGVRNARPDGAHYSDAGALAMADDAALVVREHLTAAIDRWKPLYKWLLAVPHYVVVAALSLASIFAFVIGFFAVVITGEYPHGIRDFLVNVYRYTLRVQAYAGLLTDQYPPFRLTA